MSQHYSNITLAGPSAAEVIAYLNNQSDAAYVCPGARGAVVVFHQDLANQEDLAARLSAEFSCAALLAMGFGPSILLYQLYQSGEQIDAYVSSPHDELELAEAPQGNAQTLCTSFDREHAERRVESILRKTAKPGQPYAYAANRHGELAYALGLPAFAAGASFASIEIGELPMGEGFAIDQMTRTSNGS